MNIKSWYVFPKFGNLSFLFYLLILKERLIQATMSKIVPVNEAKLFIKNVMTKLGVTSLHAEALADCLVTGDYRGHYSHGLNRLGL